jgi:hypothetical protein
MTIKIVQSWAELPAIGMQIWNPNFAHTDPAKIPLMINAETEWMPYGYNYGILCISTSTLHLFNSIQG